MGLSRDMQPARGLIVHISFGWKTVISRDEQNLESGIIIDAELIRFANSSTAPASRCNVPTLD